jgi:hypothetical protein
MSRLLRADNATIFPLLLLGGLIVTGIANVKMAQPAPPAAICGGALGPYCATVLPIELFVQHLPALSVALVLASILAAVLGTVMRQRATMAGGSITARVLQLAPGVLLVVVGLLACVLVSTVWLPTAAPFRHPY